MDVAKMPVHEESGGHRTPGRVFPREASWLVPRGEQRPGGGMVVSRPSTSGSRRCHRHDRELFFSLTRRQRDGREVGNPVEKIRTRPRPCPSNTSRVISHH